MWVKENDTVTNVFIVDLKEDRDIQDNLPLNFLNVRNDSSLVADIYLNMKRVGSIQAYSSDSFIGKNYEVLMVKQPDGNEFGINNLFCQLGKNEQMSSMPYNPSWEMLEENIDVYASGCDTRISLCADIPPELIKFMINIQNDLIVQRRLDIQGSASLGTYEITFSPDTILAGGAPINGEVLDTKQYKKTIKNSEFDFSVTNCTIKGWMIDFKGKLSDIDTVTEITGTNAKNACDTNLANSPVYTSALAAWTTVWEVEFPAIDIDRFVYYLQHKRTGPTDNCHFTLDYYNGSWNSYYNPGAYTNSTYVIKSDDTDGLALNNVTRLRVSLYAYSSAVNTVKLDYIALFE